jgi:outer membrane protein assembly factor BamB
MRNLALAGGLGALLLPLVLTPIRAGDWSQFRGPGGRGSADEADVPVQWTATENVRWKADLPGRGLSNPVIAGGRVYVTASSGYRQDRLHVLCFGEATGKKLWERQLWATGNTISHPKTCMAAPSPVTDGERVYALFATGDLACLDADGNLLWYRALTRDYHDITNQVGMAASPVLSRDVLIVPMENVGDSFIFGLDKLTGRNRWKDARARDINWVTPLLVQSGGRDAVVIQSAKELTAYDPETGTRLWDFKGDGLSTIPSPVAGPDGVYVSGREFQRLRLPADSGPPQVVWKNNRLKTGYVTPLLYRDRLYTVNPANIFVCAEAATGKILWQERLNLEGDVSASPVAADGKIYVVNEKGTTIVVRVGDRPEVLATNTLDETFLATPAIADGALFLRSDQHLYCIGAKKGK